jgi:hypothetical protein
VTGKKTWRWDPTVDYAVKQLPEITVALQALTSGANRRGQAPIKVGPVNIRPGVPGVRVQPYDPQRKKLDDLYSQQDKLKNEARYTDPGSPSGMRSTRSSARSPTRSPRPRRQIGYKITGEERKSSSQPVRLAGSSGAGQPLRRRDTPRREEPLRLTVERIRVRAAHRLLRRVVVVTHGIARPEPRTTATRTTATHLTGRHLWHRSSPSNRYRGFGSRPAGPEGRPDDGEDRHPRVRWPRPHQQRGSEQERLGRLRGPVPDQLRPRLQPAEALRPALQREGPAVAVYKAQGPKAWSTYNPSIDQKYIGQALSKGSAYSPSSTSSGTPAITGTGNDLKKQVALSLLGFGNVGGDSLDPLTMALTATQQAPTSSLLTISPSHVQSGGQVRSGGRSRL